MQRILARGEIESLDHTAIPRLRLPVRASVFADRAARLRELSNNHPLSAYLLLMANLAEGQHLALKHCIVPGPDPDQLSLAQSHGMPPIQPQGGSLEPVWQDILAELLGHMALAPNLPPAATQIIQHIQQRLHDDPAGLNIQAQAILADSPRVDAATAPIIMAALQVYWTSLATDFDLSQLPVASPHGVCPMCGSLPVASVVRVGGQADGCRYLCCGLCATEWHLVRVTCSHCQDTQHVAYHSIESGPEGIKAEACDNCHTYRKIFYQEKVLGVEAVADDLASLTLDMLMGEAGYNRASGNPLLWQNDEGTT